MTAFAVGGEEVLKGYYGQMKNDVSQIVIDPESADEIQAEVRRSFV